MKVVLSQGAKVVLREAVGDIAAGTTGTLVSASANDSLVEVQCGDEVVQTDVNHLEMLESCWGDENDY